MGNNHSGCGCHISPCGCACHLLSSSCGIRSVYFQVVDPAVDAPIRLRFELFNTTLWCAESLEEAQPLIRTAIQNTFTLPPLHAFGPKIEHQSLRDRAAAGSATGNSTAADLDQHGGGGWNAPRWFLPVVLCLSAAAFVLLLAACMCLYRWHIHRNPPVLTTKPPGSSDGSWHDANSPEGSNSLLAADAVRLGTSGRKHHSGYLLSGEIPGASGDLPAAGSTTNTKSHIMQSLHSVAVSGGRGRDITHVALDTAGTARSWHGPSSWATGSTNSTKIPRGSPGRGSGGGSRGTKTTSKGASSQGAAGDTGSDHAALECIRAEVHAAVQQLQVCLEVQRQAPML